MSILQIIDVTNYVLEQKAKNQLTSLINACVSHELRNPLNSIIAINIEKSFLYLSLRKELNKKSINKDSCLNILNQLDQGLKVQENSACLMLFLVQDLLDYAQIKSNKFRKNIESFDIRNAIKTVMSIQKKRAEEKNIDFVTKFINIDDKNCLIHTDEQRLM